MFEVFNDVQWSCNYYYVFKAQDDTKLNDNKACGGHLLLSD